MSFLTLNNPQSHINLYNNYSKISAVTSTDFLYQMMIPESGRVLARALNTVAQVTNFQNSEIESTAKAKHLSSPRKRLSNKWNLFQQLSSTRFFSFFLSFTGRSSWNVIIFFFYQWLLSVEQVSFKIMLFLNYCDNNFLACPSLAKY